MLKLLLRTFGVVILALCAMLGAIMLWPSLQQGVGRLSGVDPVSLDTLALAAGLAASSAGQIVLALALPPLLVAALSAQYPFVRRARSAVFAFFCALFFFIACETALSLFTGHIFTLRHAVKSPYVSIEYLFLILSVAGECLFMLKKLPAREGLKVWLGLKASLAKSSR